MAGPFDRLRDRAGRVVLRVELVGWAELVESAAQGEIRVEDHPETGPDPLSLNRANDP